MNYTIGIVTCTKDRPLFLRRAVESVLSQSYTNWQHVIVNDGGDPVIVNALLDKYALPYAGRVSVIHNPAPRGSAVCSNMGLSTVGTNYGVVHDDDDYWDPQFLQSCVSELIHRALPATRGVVCWSIRCEEFIENDQICTNAKSALNSWLWNITVYHVLCSNPFPQISFLFETAAFRELGGFRQDLPVLADWDFNARFVLKWNIALLRRTLAYKSFRPSATDPNHVNQSVSRQESFLDWESHLRNDWIRQDIQHGLAGKGFYSFAFAKLNEIIIQQHNQLSQCGNLTQMLMDRINDPLVSGAPSVSPASAK